MQQWIKSRKWIPRGLWISRGLRFNLYQYMYSLSTVYSLQAQLTADTRISRESLLKNDDSTNLPLQRLKRMQWGSGNCIFNKHHQMILNAVPATILQEKPEHHLILTIILWLTLVSHLTNERNWGVQKGNPLNKVYPQDSEASINSKDHAIKLTHRGLGPKINFVFCKTENFKYFYKRFWCKYLLDTQLFTSKYPHPFWTNFN